MEKQKLIYTKRYDRLTVEELKDEYEKEDYREYDDGLAEGETIIDFFEKNRHFVPNKERLADKDRFINAVSTFSESYEVDTDIYDCEAYYIAKLYMFGASYSGYCKKLLNLIFILADDFSFYEPKDKSCDVIFSFIYHTHDIYLKDRKVTELD